MTTLEKLIKQGHRVSIEAGKLVIIPASDRSIPTDWLAYNRYEIIGDILAVLGVSDIYSYQYCTVGQYGGYSTGGLTLQFQSTLTCDSFYAVFNVSLKRARTTKGGKKGTNLPKGQFIPPKDGGFCKFWSMTGAKTPQSKAEFYKRMGNLKPFHFAASLHDTANNRLQSGTLKPIDTTHDAIARAIHRSIKTAY